MSRVEIWPYAERYTPHRQPHPRPRPVGQVCREHADTSPARHRAESREYTRLLNQGCQRKRGNHAALQLRKQMQQRHRPLRPRLPQVTVRALRGRLRAGFHRAKGRAQQVKGPWDVPARLAQAGLSREKTLITQQPRRGSLRAREPTGQRPRPQRSAQGQRRIARRVPSLHAPRSSLRSYLLHDEDYSIYSTSRSSGESSTTTFAYNVAHFGRLQSSWRR